MRSSPSSRVLRTLLPGSCPVCGAVGAAPCSACWRELRPAPAGPVPAGLDRCRSLLSYEGTGRELIARLKYRNARGVVSWLAGGMAALAARWVAAVEGGGLAVVIVTWAPTTPARRRARGYDQAELLARAVAAELALPCVALLRRLPGPPQTGRSRDERWHGPSFTTRAPPSRTLGERAVVLVDDLLTTGATLSAAASALRTTAAPSSVVGLTAGRTPRHRDRPAAASA